MTTKKMVDQQLLVGLVNDLLPNAEKTKVRLTNDVEVDFPTFTTIENAFYNETIGVEKSTYSVGVVEYTVDEYATVIVLEFCHILFDKPKYLQVMNLADFEGNWKVFLDICEPKEVIEIEYVPASDEYLDGVSTGNHSRCYQTVRSVIKTHHNFPMEVLNDKGGYVNGLELKQALEQYPSDILKLVTEVEAIDQHEYWLIFEIISDEGSRFFKTSTVYSSWTDLEWEYPHWLKKVGEKVIPVFERV